MSGFSDGFAGCMSGKSLPAPAFETANDVLEFIHKAHSALKVLGASPEMTLVEFVAVAVAAGLIATQVGGALLEGGETVGEVLVMEFLTACVACLVSAAGPSIAGVLASNPPDALVREQFAQLGVNLDDPGACGFVIERNRRPHSHVRLLVVNDGGGDLKSRPLLTGAKDYFTVGLQWV